MGNLLQDGEAPRLRLMWTIFFCVRGKTHLYKGCKSDTGKFCRQNTHTFPNTNLWSIYI